MSKQTQPKRLPLSLPQVFLIVLALLALFVIIGFSRHNNTHGQIVDSRATFQAAVDAESTRKVQLEATLTYVESVTYLEHYYRNEEGMVLEGERRLAPNVIEVTPTPTPQFEQQSTTQAVNPAQPWQMWWRLLTDAPFPTE